MNEVDLSHEVERTILGDVKVKMTAVEDVLYWYMQNGCRIQIAEKGDDVVGILVYHKIFDTIIAVRMMYLPQSHQGTYAGKGLVSSVNPKRVIFQTRKESPPTTLFKVTEGRRRLLDESDKLLTFEMEWSV